MKQLIPHTIQEAKEMTPIEHALSIDKDGFTTAKKLYAWLELDESNYARWVKMNIIDNPFAEEGVDYSSCMKSKKAGATLLRTTAFPPLSPRSWR